MSDMMMIMMMIVIAKLGQRSRCSNAMILLDVLSLRAAPLHFFAPKFATLTLSRLPSLCHHRTRKTETLEYCSLIIHEHVLSLTEELGYLSLFCQHWCCAMCLVSSNKSMTSAVRTFFHTCWLFARRAMSSTLDGTTVYYEKCYLIPQATCSLSRITINESQVGVICNVILWSFASRACCHLWRTDREEQGWMPSQVSKQLFE